MGWYFHIFHSSYSQNHWKRFGFDALVLSKEFMSCYFMVACLDQFWSITAGIMKNVIWYSKKFDKIQFSYQSNSNGWNNILQKTEFAFHIFSRISIEILQQMCCLINSSANVLPNLQWIIRPLTCVCIN